MRTSILIAALATASLATAGILALPQWSRRLDADAWQRLEDARLRARHAVVQQTLLDLEAHARAVGQRALALSDSNPAATTQQRTQLFADLRTALEREAAPATVGTRASGVQILDPQGHLLAWAGTPHALDASTRLSPLAGPQHPVGFRRSGVYTLLSVESRADSTRPHRRRAVVDVPVDVSYQLSNRFLQSRSLAADLSGGGVEVEFSFAETMVPPHLARADIDIHGGESHWRRADCLLRDASGAPLVVARLDGLSVDAFAERRRARNTETARWLSVLAAALAATAVLALPAARRGRWLPFPWPHIAAIWGIRMLLAGLGLPASRLESGVLNPATFAMVGFGNTLRSPLDLVLTAAALALSAACLFVWMVQRAGARDRGVDGWPRAWLATLSGAAVTGILVLAAFRFVARVAGDSNPILLGSQLDLLSLPVICLHGGILAATGALLVLAMLSVHALRRGSGNAVATVVAAMALGIVLARVATPVVGGVGMVVFLAGTRLRLLLADERFTSFALAGFGLAAMATTLDVAAIQREYFRNQQQLVQERAEDVLHPNDDFRRFVLEDVLGKIRAEEWIAEGLRSNHGADRGALAFQVWAQSILSHLGYSCQVQVFDRFGLEVSEFDIDMAVTDAHSTRTLLERARADTSFVIEVETGDSSAGALRTYGGAVAIRDRRDSDPNLDEPLGTVLIELPFASSSLELAANPRRRAPELLRNLQQEGVGPRVEESERLLLAWLEAGFVVESSTPYLEVGQAPPSGAERWQRLRLANCEYWVTRRDAGARVLLAGFPRRSRLDELLEWTQIGSFGFAVTFLLLGVGMLAARILGAGRLPQLLTPKRLGFQQKLMAAFLVVSLLPSVFLSLATRDIMRDRSRDRNRDATLAKARAAEAALSDLLRRDLDAVRESEYLRAVITTPNEPPVRDIGHLEFSQVMIFRGDGALVLDETLSNLSDDEARAFVRAAPRGVFASRDGRHLCLGALEKIWFSPLEGLVETAPDAQPYYIYFRRRLTDEVLRRLVPILGTDLSAFLGPQLAVSSRRSLAVAGLLPALVPAEAFAHVQLRRNRYAIVEESTGTQRSFAGYLPLEDVFGARIGALAVSQLLQPDEFAIEVERTRGLVLGLSTLMFVLTLGLGVGFAARIFDPIRNLIDGTRRLARGDLQFRLQARSGDEIGELERSFNDMAARLETARVTLEERQRYLEAILGHIASGVLATDRDGRVTAANPAAYRILGVEPGSLAGRSLREVATRGPAGVVRHFWQRIEAAPDGDVVEIPLLRAEERLTLRVVVTDLRMEEARERLGRVAIFEDVTDLIRSKKLSAWAEMARQVAHEIKNPLTPMKLSAQFMEQAYRDRSDKFPEIFRDGMATIVEQVDNLRRIAGEFSNFGRVQKLEPRPLDLGVLLQRASAPYRNIAGLAWEGLDGDGAAFPGTGIRVLGDEDGLRKVFSNVLENARESMNGRGRIGLRVMPTAEGRVEVRICDTGPGVSEEARSRLFEPYFSTKSTGSGLGLAITKSILEELGGTIAIGNRPEGGAEARITLVVC
jgi:PAS domain S-box-containing protein